jgi:hypothetical protein
VKKSKFSVGGVVKRTLSLVFLLSLMLAACQNRADSSAERAATPASPASSQSQLSGQEHLAKAKEHLHEAKEILDKQGTYDCCIEPDCDWCALKEGSCPCARLLKGRKPVCPDCKFGWDHGKGHLEGIRPEQVTTTISHTHGTEDTGKPHKH